MAKKEENHLPKIVPENDLEKKILEAFEVFDHTGKHVVDVREIGTVLRSLGCCPTEAEIQEVILKTENKEATGTIPACYFVPYMVKAMTERRFYPASAEELLAAFRYFDPEGCGYLTKERFAKLMMEEGEPFMQMRRLLERERATESAMLTDSVALANDASERQKMIADEFDEMMQTALDPVTDTIAYEYYINQLMVRNTRTNKQTFRQSADYSHTQQF